VRRRRKLEDAIDEAAVLGLAQITVVDVDYAITIKKKAAATLHYNNFISAL